MVIPAVVVPLGGQQFVDGVEVASYFTQAGMSFSDALPPPPPHCVRHQACYHDGRVDLEVELPADVRGDVAGVSHRPAYSIMGA